MPTRLAPPVRVLICSTGEAFVALVFTYDPDTFAEFKVKEIKNDRLAVFSMLGYFAQVIVTGEGPVENWVAHVATDPLGTNDLSLALMGQFAPYPWATFAASGNVSDNLTAWYGPERNKWSCPSPDASTLDYLTGEYPGDYSCLTTIDSVKQMPTGLVFDASAPSTAAITNWARVVQPRAPPPSPQPLQLATLLSTGPPPSPTHPPRMVGVGGPAENWAFPTALVFDADSTTVSCETQLSPSTVAMPAAR